MNIYPDERTYFWVIILTMRFWCSTESSFLISICSHFLTDRIPWCCKHGCGIRHRYFVAFLAGGDWFSSGTCQRRHLQYLHFKDLIIHWFIDYGTAITLWFPHSWFLS
jgi:hypothetical protein